MCRQVDKNGPSKEKTIIKDEDEEEDTVDLVTPVKAEDGDKDARSESTPDKSAPSSCPKKKKTQPITNVTPRRSSRNLNKTKSYFDESEVKSEEEDDVQEVPSTSVNIIYRINNNIMINMYNMYRQQIWCSLNCIGHGVFFFFLLMFIIIHL